MNRFDDLFQRVSLLNFQIQSMEENVGSEVRMILHKQLWSIVGELNASLNLGLDNTALDLAVDRDRLVISYFSGVGGSAEREVKLFIDRLGSVKRRTKILKKAMST
jgi:hypothetical protein